MTFDLQMTFDLHKNNRLLLLNVVHLHTKYEICASFPSWDIMFTRFSQFDPCWPQMTFDIKTKNKFYDLSSTDHYCQVW